MNRIGDIIGVIFAASAIGWLYMVTYLGLTYNVRMVEAGLCPRYSTGRSEPLWVECPKPEPLLRKISL